MVMVVTGVAAHSIGEAIVQQLAAIDRKKLICIDIQSNAWLTKRAQYYDLQLDLNPLTHPRGIIGFAEQATRELSAALRTVHDEPITHLIQCAGVYSAGRLLDSSPQTRMATYGVNAVGHIELLRSVMHINSDHKVNNAETLVHVEVGSAHGLNPRKERSLYASSKSWGIDFAAALTAGTELKRAVYFAMGPVDTYMLHRNHWTDKAGGSASFIDGLRSGERSIYERVFMECSEQAFAAATKDRPNLDQMLTHFKRYRQARAEAASDYLGMLSADECAQMILHCSLQESESGVYVCSKEPGMQPAYKYRSFADMQRLSRFKE
jgi:short-subunit dehydrogenase